MPTPHQALIQQLDKIEIDWELRTKIQKTINTFYFPNKANESALEAVETIKSVISKLNNEELSHLSREIHGIADWIEDEQESRKEDSQ